MTTPNPTAGHTPMTAEQIVCLLLQSSRLRSTLNTLVGQAHGALQLARIHEAEGAHALAIRERADAQYLIERASTLLYGASFGWLSALFSAELQRPVEHECVRVVREAVAAGRFEDLE